MRLSGKNLCRDRRTLAVAVTLLALLAGGCGGEGGQSASTTPEKTTARTVKVGLVTDINQLNDRGFNHLAYVGLQRAQRRLGVEGRVLQSKTAADYVPNMTSLVRDGFDLIVAVGYAQAAAVETVAGRFPNARIAIIDVEQSSLAGKPKNVVGLVFREQEVGYLAGYLAGLVEKRRPGENVVGSVGGMKEPPVDRFIAGYQAGAKEADPGIELLNAYSQDWVDQSKCKELALNQIAEGAGVVFQVAGGCGLGALDAARQRGVWGIGVDADQSFLGPFVLTSAVKRVDESVFLTIRSIVEGRWKGGRNLVFGLRQNGVGLGKVSGKIPASDLRQLEEIQRQIADGNIQVPTTF